MSKIFGKYGPRWPRLGKLLSHIPKLSKNKFNKYRIYRLNASYSLNKISQLQNDIKMGKTVYIAGFAPFSHNSGVALISVSQKEGITLLYNNEEERFVGIKHYNKFPHLSLNLLAEQMESLGLTLNDIHAWVTTWDYFQNASIQCNFFFSEFPFNYYFLLPSFSSIINYSENVKATFEATGQLGKAIGLPSLQPIITSPHHDNHAASAYCLSPFGKYQDNVMIVVLDGWGDEGAISTYQVKNGEIIRLYKNYDMMDSLGVFYSLLSSTQGGWTVLSSEGRFMGAAAWGDMDRLTNPYYMGLREIFHFAPNGKIFLNRSMANWHLAFGQRPYKQALIDLIGPPIPPDKLWNPDQVLNVKDINHSPNTRKRCDIAAATQLVFEDALFHIVGHLIRTTKYDKLVMAGGSVLNCLGNMKLLEKFNGEWYQKNLGIDSHLHLWVPPFPSDCGATIGAAMNFALKAGVSSGKPLQHAFYCGAPPKTLEIDDALASDSEIKHRKLGKINTSLNLDSLTDLMAYILSKNGVLGLFQGAAETGPRALGHRSILANPCNPDTLATINRLVKYREPLRPLAPMVTLQAAKELFELLPGAQADNYNAYNYMVITVRARPKAYDKIPSAIHKDGTVRLQIVRPEHDIICYSFLKAMGRRVGVEASINTSLNVGSPIVQTPIQAIQALKRAKAMTGLVIIGKDGTVYLAWKNPMTHTKSSHSPMEEFLKDWGEGNQEPFKKEQHIGERAY